MSTVVINNISALDGQDILGDGSNATTIQGIPVSSEIPDDNDLLVYDIATNSYIPESPGENILDLNDLKDVNTTGVSNNQLLVFNFASNTWITKTLTSTEIAALLKADDVAKQSLGLGSAAYVLDEQ